MIRLIWYSANLVTWEFFHFLDIGSAGKSIFQKKRKIIWKRGWCFTIPLSVLKCDVSNSSDTFLILSGFKCKYIYIYIYIYIYLYIIALQSISLSYFHILLLPCKSLGMTSFSNVFVCRWFVSCVIILIVLFSTELISEGNKQTNTLVMFLLDSSSIFAGKGERQDALLTWLKKVMLWSFMQNECLFCRVSVKRKGHVKNEITYWKVTFLVFGF